MKVLALLMMCSFVAPAFAVDPKETMCVKQKDGTYKCKASGKIEKVPCCDTPSNDPKPTPKPKKQESGSKLRRSDQRLLLARRFRSGLFEVPARNRDARPVACYQGERRS
jgi:hypothetical protein